MTAPALPADRARTVLRLAIWSALAGVLTIIVASSPILALVIDEVTQRPPAELPEHAEGLAAASFWMMGVVLVGAIALTLDVLLLVRLGELHRAARLHGMRPWGTWTLGSAVLLGSGWVSTPVLIMVFLLLALAVGPDRLPTMAFDLLLALLCLLPLAGRILQVALASRIRRRAAAPSAPPA